MIAQRHVLFSDTFTFRRSVSISLIATVLFTSVCFPALGTIALLFDYVAASVVAFVLSIVLFVVDINWVCHYARNHTEEIWIDDDGVRCGSEVWSWERLKAIRVFPTPRGYQLMIWPNRDRGVGRALPMDNPLSSADAQRLLRDLKKFAEGRRLELKYGEFTGRRKNRLPARSGIPAESP